VRRGGKGIAPRPTLGGPRHMKNAIPDIGNGFTPLDVV
jgi:hypothetical protein